MNVQKEEKMEDSELLMRGEEGAIVEDSFDKIQEEEQDDNEEEVSSVYFLYWLKIIKKMCTIFRKLTIVCYGRETAQKNRNLLDKKIITDNCLLQEKNNILNLLER